MHASHFGLSGRHSPHRAGDMAYKLFCRPALSPHAPPDQETLVARARAHLQSARWFKVATPAGLVQAYEYAPPPEARPGRTVLLVHGWTSEASFMAAFVEPLRQRGHKVVSFDFPAHGYSTGRETNMVDCARAMNAVIEHVGSIHAIVAHSVGSLIALMVAEGRPPLPAGRPAGRYALIAPPNRLQRMTDRFCDYLELDTPAKRIFERHVERAGRRPLTQLSCSELLAALDAPALVVHSRDDDQVPYADSEEIAAACPKARLVTMEGLGHGRVLYAPPVVKRVREFIDLVETDPQRPPSDRVSNR